jgi:hypothetical protein
MMMETTNRYPVVVQETSDMVIPKSLMSAGNGTLTTVSSSRPRNESIAVATITSTKRGEILSVSRRS